MDNRRQYIQFLIRYYYCYEFLIEEEPAWWTDEEGQRSQGGNVYILIGGNILLASGIYGQMEGLYTKIGKPL